MDFNTTLKVIMESPKADNHTLQEYKKWCNANNEYVDDKKALDKFSKKYFNNSEDIKKFLSSVISFR